MACSLVEGAIHLNMAVSWCLWSDRAARIRIPRTPVVLEREAEGSLRSLNSSACPWKANLKKHLSPGTVRTWQFASCRATAINQFSGGTGWIISGSLNMRHGRDFRNQSVPLNSRIRQTPPSFFWSRKVCWLETLVLNCLYPRGKKIPGALRPVKLKFVPLW